MKVNMRMNHVEFATSMFIKVARMLNNGALQRNHTEHSNILRMFLHFRLLTIGNITNSKQFEVNTNLIVVADFSSTECVISTILRNLILGFGNIRRNEIKFPCARTWLNTNQGMKQTSISVKLYIYYKQKHKACKFTLFNKCHYTVTKSSSCVILHDISQLSIMNSQT